MLLGWDFAYERDGKAYRTQVSTGLIERVNYPIMMDKVIDARERRTDPVINNLFFRPEPEAVRREAPGTGVPAAAVAAGTQAEERQGTIFNFNSEKGFGFIKPAGGGDNIFFHISEIRNAAAEHLKPSQQVTFNLAKTERGHAAHSVFVTEILPAADPSQPSL
jgi:cold shock CspA family protein